MIDRIQQSAWLARIKKIAIAALTVSSLLIL
jgi:hypothetical protein